MSGEPTAWERASSSETREARSEGVVGPEPREPTRVVLIRHGEAVCNVAGIVGGARGCTGLTETGVAQATSLRDRLARTGELRGVAALYSSVLPRARQTADIIAPALDRWRSGPPLQVREECSLCELHPGEADALSWPEFLARYEAPDWDIDPTTPIAPGGESWSTFVDRASTAVHALADEHPGGLIVVVCHAGVVESTVLRFLPVASRTPRLGLRTDHASMTVWERGVGWLLRRYNDATPTTPGAHGTEDGRPVRPVRQQA